MNVKSAQVWSGLIVCKDSTGALSTPSVGPTGALYVNGTVNAASVTITGTNPYKWSVTLPTLTAGDIVSMYITATIATIASAGVVAEASADTKFISDAPANSAGVTTMVADYARRTGDYATVAALATLQGNVTAILTDYARRTGDYSVLDAAGVRTAVGLATANLDAQLAAIATYIDTEVAAILAAANAIKTKTDHLPSADAGAANGLPVLGPTVNAQPIIADLQGSVVGSVAGNVEGNVVGSVGYVEGSIGGDLLGKVIGQGASVISGVGALVEVDGGGGGGGATSLTFETTELHVSDN